MPVNKFLRINEKLNLKNKKINFVKLFNMFDYTRDGNLYDIQNVIITLSGAGTTEYNKVYYENGVINGFMSYLSDDGYSIIYNGLIWRFFTPLGNFQYYSQDDVALEDITVINTYAGGLEPVPTISKSLEIISQKSTMLNPFLILESEEFKQEINTKFLDKNTNIEINEKFEYFNVYLKNYDMEENILNDDYLIQVNYEENEPKKLKQDIKFKEINLKKLY